jgi:hypothetical protein
MNEQNPLTAPDIYANIKKDVATHGVIFNFKTPLGKVKTGIIRKGQWKEGIFLNGFLPQYRKLTRKERRHL